MAAVRAVTTLVACLVALSVATGAQPVPAAEQARLAAREVVMPDSATAFRLTSPAFADGTSIPKRHTADGEDLSPKLVIAGAPAAVKSFALIADDPDAPVGTWVHWVVWSIPAGVTEIAEGKLPEGAVSGRNSWRRNGWGGPSPPSGTHRYFFKLYALDTVLELPQTTDAAGLERAMKGHVLGQATLMGTYSRGR